jgi:hypothetical protein
VVEHHIQYYGFPMPHQLPDEQLEELRTLVFGRGPQEKANPSNVQLSNDAYGS